MLPAPVLDAFSMLAAALVDREDAPGASDIESALVAAWRASASATGPTDPGLAPEVRAAVDSLAAALPALTTSDEQVSALGDLFEGAGGAVLLLWCWASTWRRDARLAPILAIAARREELREHVAAIARDRVVEGPLLDALACVPLLDDVASRLSNDAQTRARLEILIWEAGASALELPALGRCIWSSPETFDAMIHAPAHGALRGRVLAARCLEISACGMPPTTHPDLVGRTLQVLQPLLLHPEPLVWVHAARALGRLTGQLEQLEGTLLDWSFGESRVLRQRAVTAFASLPAQRLAFLASQLVAILDARDEEAWVLAAVAAATPYLFFERRALWDRLAKRVLAGDGGAIAARALARGLATIWRRGDKPVDVERPLRALREMARGARPSSLDELRRWIEVIAVTDVLDGAERDPLDLELGMENLVRMAAQYDDEEADARAGRFAEALMPAFAEAWRIAWGGGRLRQRAAAINALEGCARALALRLWGPLLATRPTDDPLEEPALGDLHDTIARAPAEILDRLKEARQTRGADPDADLPLEVLAIRLGGYALDACGADSDLGRGRGQTAHDTCLWLRKLDGLADGSRDLPASLKGALSTLFWRLVDTTRGTALGEVDDVRWLGPFAAWWALVIDRPAMLLQLATALPMMAEGALAWCCDQAEALRTAVASGAPEGQWGGEAAGALEALCAEGTELAHALAGLAIAVADFGRAAGPHPELEAMCEQLVLAATRLHGALSDPVTALHPVSDESADDSLARSEISRERSERRGEAGGRANSDISRERSERRGEAGGRANSDIENAPRVAALVARAIRTREASLLEVWFASLGPIASALLEAAVLAAIRRTPPPPPKPKKPEVEVIEGYELIKPLGEGGIGRVWLVRKPGADRLFVLKIPKADALANATDVERAVILDSFVEEAKALAGLYHPNVANIIDRGVSGDVPFLVLEYLIGADLKQYSTAHRMSFFELRQVVLESCAGLAALHGAGLVHRDIKPANIWLRLPLAGGERFDPAVHRDPARAQPLAAVVIDFGMVRAIRVPKESCGRFVAGTAGYIAPEQVLDPVELDPRSDIYGLAGTIYNVTTGRAFFDDLTNERDRFIAHMRRDPFDDVERLRGFPAGVAKILRAATQKDPSHRPSPTEFGREFVAAL